MDKGPWYVYIEPGGRVIGVSSDDFDHDAVLELKGDFEDNEQRRKYCQWLATALNAGGGAK